MQGAYLIFAIPMALSVIGGFTIAFVLTPYWLFRGRPLTPMQKMVARFALIGLLIPLLFAVRYAVTRTEILSLSIWVWPSSLGMMGLDGFATTGDVVIGFAVTGLSNVGVYAFIGWIVAMIRYRPQGGQIHETKL